MGYSYVYPPLKPAAASKSDHEFEFEPLPTSPANSQNPQNPLIPKLNPPKEFQSFLDNIGNKFNFAARREPERSGQPAATGDLSGKTYFWRRSLQL